jgi:SARP family transcriptional regulator, regulator of embCAB operon
VRRTGGPLEEPVESVHGVNPHSLVLRRPPPMGERPDAPTAPGRHADRVWAAGTPGADPGLQVGLLGPLVVARDGVPVESIGPRARAVLATLALRAGHPVSTATLIDRVWGDDPPATARNTVQTHVAHLRQALQPHRSSGDTTGLLATVGDGYLLAIARDAVDAHRFELLVRHAARSDDPAACVEAAGAALALWRGEPLAELTGPVAAGERTRLVELRLQASRSRASALVELGASGEAIAGAEAIVAEHPYDEAGWSILMRALYAAGRQADALTAFQRARTVLRDELGIDPSPPLRALEAAILAHDPTLGARPPTVSTGVRPEAGTPEHPCPPLTVVVVDDHLVVREGLRQLIELDAGLRVAATCSTPAELHAVLAGGAPAVVVTDIRMPPTFTDEGIALARSLRTTHPDVAVLVVSHHVDPGYARATFEGGAAQRGYLLKDTVRHPEQLAQAIRTIAAGGSWLDPIVIDQLTAVPAPSRLAS